MDKIIIHGGKPLKGEVTLSGAKNAVLPIMAASLLVGGTTHISRVPDLRDTRTMIKLLELVGAKTHLKGNDLWIDSEHVDTPVAPYDLVKTMRASFYVLGPLLARFGETKVSLPGGCAWGPRPVDYHLRGLELLGAKVTLEKGYIHAKAKRLKGNHIHFDFPSVGATGNILMAAVTAHGTTVIENAACEPEIVQLCQFLNLMGGKITGIGTHKISVEGVKELSPSDVSVIPDRIEAGTFLIAGAALGEVTVLGGEPGHLKVLLEKLEQTGAKIKISGKKISVRKSDVILPVDVTTAVFPGYPTDLQAQWIALMTIAKGDSVVTDTVYHDRFSHVPELNRLGAEIQVSDNVACIKGRK
ncbi:MAG TPA: UDP-N-acetylglucosamine 1-carboxyvinyltransferase, partial [Candidatus Marinimicrobia bacterium]|nr:UDP-N-acetylglucosamine 1-carboxyvinyltransferase [Candidatus Neomarinimicrobiota bacterium]